MIEERQAEVMAQRRGDGQVDAQRNLINDRAHHAAVLAAAAQTIVQIDSEEEVREALAKCLRGLFRDVGQFELFIKGDGDTLLPVASAGAGHVRSALRLLSGLRARLTVRSGGHVLAEPYVFPALLGVRRGSLMSAPLLDRSARIGLVIVETEAGTPDFDATDLETLSGVAALFSLALQRLHARALDQVQARVARDLKEARRVQQQLMTGSLPEGAGVTAFAEYLPVFDVGGDFYDLGLLADGRITAVVGDVSGKGVTAALVMSRVTSEFRRFRDGARSPADVLARVNDSMMLEESETFATAACLTIDPRARTLEIANAGHPPLIVRRATGEVFTFGTPSGTPLGMLPCDYASESLSLEPGDIVLMLTDGIIEALDRPSDRMGVELLLGVIKYAPHHPKLIIERALAALDKMKGTKPLDDMTFLALQLDRR